MKHSLYLRNLFNYTIYTMRKFIVLLLILNLFQSCLKEKSINEQSIEIVEKIQKGNIKAIEEVFYSKEYFNSLKNIDTVLYNYEKIIGSLKIDKPENVVSESLNTIIDNDFFPKDTLQIFTTYVPIDVNMPSPVPSYYMKLNFIKEKSVNKLIGLELQTSKQPESINKLEVLTKINIDSRRILDYAFMYEGGYKNPLVFKREEGWVNELKKNKGKFDTLLNLINNSNIVKSQKELDTRRFNGDPELGIVHLEMNNNHTWTLFTLISEEEGKKEDFHGALELRYYKYLNIAVTYWIDSENNDLLKRIMLDLCNSGENRRTEPKKSRKLEIRHTPK